MTAMGGYGEYRTSLLEKLLTSIYCSSPMTLRVSAHVDEEGIYLNGSRRQWGNHQWADLHSSSEDSAASRESRTISKLEDKNTRMTYHQRFEHLAHRQSVHQKTSTITRTSCLSVPVRTIGNASNSSNKL